MKTKCILWNKSLENGYGRRRVNGKLVYAHRHAYEQEYGPIPDGLIVRHECDVRACIEPQHLRLGTHKQNAMDRVARGRQGDTRGEKNGTAKLREKDVKQIRAEYAEGSTTQRKLAEKYGVKLYCIFAIVNYKTWKHI